MWLVCNTRTGLSLPLLQTFGLDAEFAKCKPWGMTTNDLYTGLRGMGVSPGYASQISNGKRRPSLSLAIRIYRSIGAKVGPIANLSKSEIATLEKVGSKNLVQ